MNVPSDKPPGFLSRCLFALILLVLVAWVVCRTACEYVFRDQHQGFHALLDALIAVRGEFAPSKKKGTRP